MEEKMRKEFYKTNDIIGMMKIDRNKAAKFMKRYGTKIGGVRVIRSDNYRQLEEFGVIEAWKKMRSQMTKELVDLGDKRLKIFKEIMSSLKQNDIEVYIKIIGMYPDEKLEYDAWYIC